MAHNDTVIDLEDLEMTPLLKRVIVFSSGGPFLEGYVLAIIGVAMQAMGNDLVLDAHWRGLLGVASLVGLFLGASVGGWLTDLIGRRKMFVIDLVVIAVLSILCAVVQSPIVLLILRFLVGVAVGADYPIATSMIAEFSPRKYRAGAMGIIAAAWYLGANVAALVGFCLYNTAHGWRYMLASSAIPCILILVGRWDIPESPRWLVSKGRAEEAQAIVHKTLGENVRLPAAEEAAKTSVSKVLRGVYLQRIIFIGVIWLCQAIPMFAFYTYGEQIIGSAIGLEHGRDALLVEAGAVHIGHAVDVVGAAGNPAAVGLDKLVDGTDVVGVAVREDDADDLLVAEPAQDPLRLRARVEDDGAGLVRESVALGLPRSDGHLFDRKHLNAP